ncbi:hypothetical protein WME97_14515 [Sorangium sp. So ce367]|uniref:hypothetical protein n=1 Tax=Sorangium sp. So ce367 TaxID=3133305 RepID=UPI003F5E7F2A
MTTAREILDFYTHPAAMTSGGAHARRFDDLPGDTASLVRVVQGLLLNQHWAQAYGVTLSDERRNKSHLRPVDRMLDRLFAHDERSLSAARPPDTRLVPATSSTTGSASTGTPPRRAGSSSMRRSTTCSGRR